MSDDIDFRPDQFERELARLPDVRSARVVSTPSGRLTEIHLITEGDKTAKQISRDVQTYAQAQYGVEIDHRIISVVQFPGEAPATIGTAPPSRPKLTLASVQWTTEGNRATCRVRIEVGDQSQIGEETGPATSVGRRRLVARATTTAVHALGNEFPSADIQDVLVVEVGEHRVAVAFLVILNDSGETVSTGSAPVRGDESDAIARAVLDAMNRHLRE
jgi:hypothetical protein